MIQSAEKYPVSDLFGTEKDIKYIVPKYQREYVWGKGNWEKLFDDIIENPKGHFLGSIITVNKNTDALAITELELIDGQQRFVTISLLYAAIYYLLTFDLEDNEKDDEIRSEIINLKYRIVQKSNKSNLKVEPSYQRNNFQDYMVILDELKLKKNNFEVKNTGNRKIYKAYNYFYSRLTEKDEKEIKIFCTDDVLEFLNKLNSTLLVKIEVNNHSDAFTLFETINNTGVKLSAIDLIKNNILSQYEKKLGGSIDDAFNDWLKVIDNLSDDVACQERFLRQYYNAFKHNTHYKIDKINKATKSNLINIYDELIKRNVELTFTDLVEKSQVYGDLVFADNEKISNEINNLLLDLDRIGGAPSYTLLLYIFSEYKKNDKLKINILNLLMKYFVRRNLTDIPPTRDLDNIFIKLVEEIEKDKDNISIVQIKQNLTKDNNFADEKLFKEKLSGNIYEENMTVARFILCKIEENNNKTKEIYTNLWARDNSDKFIWTIEHIFPQGQNIPKSWIDMIANGDKNLALQYLDSHVHTLGNLTLTGYNSKLSNYSFKDKRDRNDRKENFVGYKNGLFLNRILKSKNFWNIKDIEDRTKELINETIKIFKL